MDDTSCALAIFSTHLSTTSPGIYQGNLSEVSWYYQNCLWVFWPYPSNNSVEDFTWKLHLHFQAFTFAPAQQPHKQLLVSAGIGWHPSDLFPFQWNDLCWTNFPNTEVSISSSQNTTKHNKKITQRLSKNSELPDLAPTGCSLSFRTSWPGSAAQVPLIKRGLHSKFIFAFVAHANAKLYPLEQQYRMSESHSDMPLH